MSNEANQHELVNLYDRLTIQCQLSKKQKLIFLVMMP